MKKDTETIINELNRMRNELTEVKKIVSMQSEQIETLKKQLFNVTTVNIEEDGKQKVESYGNLILDEVLALKKKLEGFSAEGMRSVVNELASFKNRAENGEEGEISLSELKGELLKLADMMTV